MDRLLSLGQVHGGRPGAAVFDDVLQRLLRHAEQTECCVGRDAWASRTVSELDSNAISTRHVVAKTGDGRGEPEQFELRRVKVMRQAVGPDPFQWTVAVSGLALVLRCSPEGKDDACGAGGKLRSLQFSTGSTRRAFARFSNS